MQGIRAPHALMLRHGVRIQRHILWHAVQRGALSHAEVKCLVDILPSLHDHVLRNIGAQDQKRRLQRRAIQRLTVFGA